MHLEFTPEQDELRATVREVLARECPPSVVRERMEKGAAATTLWRRLLDLGWTALTLPESVGGLGLGPVEMAVVAEELGRCVAPVPWLSTVTQYAAVVRESAAREQRAALLGPVAAGEVSGALAVAEDGSHPLRRRDAGRGRPAPRDRRTHGEARRG